MATLGAWLAVALVSLAGCSKPESPPVMVFAAASATEAIEELATKFQETDGTPTRTNFTGSSTLAQQIIAGAPADVFLSASESWADAVEKQGLVARRRDLLSNRLVIVAPTDGKLDIQGLGDLASAAIARIALADESVPAGHYARQALANSNLWDAVRPKAVSGADVRQALLFVERGDADAGIVYATDARQRDKVRVVATIDSRLHEQIRYPLVLVKRATENPAAGRFFDLASGPAGAEVFRKYGFTMLDRAPTSKAGNEQPR